MVVYCGGGEAARAGHLIYCYGDCNRDIDLNDPEDTGEDLLKKYWLEAIERPCDDAQFFYNKKRNPNKKLFTVRFCE